MYNANECILLKAVFSNEFAIIYDNSRIQNDNNDFISGLGSNSGNGRIKIKEGINVKRIKGERMKNLRNDLKE